MRNFSDKIVQKIKTHVLCSVISPPPENRALYEITRQNMVHPAQITDDNTIRRMRFTCRMPKATNTHSEYVKRTTFPLQQWLLKRASLLRYMHIACLFLYFSTVCG